MQARPHGTHEAARLPAARAPLEAPAPAPAVSESVDDFLRILGRLDGLTCPHCGAIRLGGVAAIAPERAPWIRARAPP